MNIATHCLEVDVVNPKWKWLIIFASVLLLGADDKNEDTSKDASNLQGTWKIVSSETAGEKDADTVGFKLVFAGTTMSLQTADGKTVYMGGKFKLDTSTKPRRIDITGKSPVHGDEVTVYGIYELNGDDLIICSAVAPSKVRPTEFATKGAKVGKIQMDVLKRIKP